jgi:hypothetical protein
MNTKKPKVRRGSVKYGAAAPRPTQRGHLRAVISLVHLSDGCPIKACSELLHTVRWAARYMSGPLIPRPTPEDVLIAFANLNEIIEHRGHENGISDLIATMNWAERNARRALAKVDRALPQKPKKPSARREPQ